MPDFEALIKQQQLKQPESKNRLKIVNSEKFNEKTHSIYKPRLIYYFLAGFSGSLLGTISLLFLYENHLLTLNIGKLNELIQIYF